MRGVLRNVGSLARCLADGGQHEVHALDRGALVWEGAQLVWVGPEAKLPGRYAGFPTHDAGGGLVVPGLVDCHTHLAFGGWRGDEFERRVRGDSYLEIAKEGGGIASTVRATRAAADDELLLRVVGVLAQMLRLGVTTVEAKSGYGLSHEQELRLLETYREASFHDVELVPTYLGAHVVPPELRDEPGGRERYVEEMCTRTIPEVAARKLAEFVDVFVEEGAYTLDEARRIFGAAAEHGLRPRLHADQLSDGGGAALAAEVGALSADHLECASDEGLRAMAAAGVVAVVLPFASLYTFQAPVDARRLIAAGVPVAVATDFNPGSAPSYDLPTALSLACTLDRMTPAQALKGATIVAARALGRDAQIGSLEAGKRANVAVYDAPDVNHWLYHLRPGACRMVVANGRIAYDGAA